MKFALGVGLGLVLGLVWVARYKSGLQAALLFTDAQTRAAWEAFFDLGRQ